MLVGVFDLNNYGHQVALRDAHEMTQNLYVSIPPQKDITSNKYKVSFPIYSENERIEMLQECRWVKEVYCGKPNLDSTSLSELDNDLKIQNLIVAEEHSHEKMMAIPLTKACIETNRLK